ncbi:MAG: MTAP family purine nucleoside phosphorylase [Caldilineales bacterium]|nr:MTAP family purine nucleoside phosphorylase [Caldilineales bacterium]
MIPPPTLIIGGTAAYGLDLAAYHPLGQAEVIATPYGASPPITFLQPDAGSPPVAFCSRHGHDRLQRSAAFVNHRATIWAAKMLGVQAIFSWNGTGAIAHHLEVGDLVIPHDFLDFSRTRIATFGEADLPPASGPAFHPAARAALLAAAESLAPASVHSAGVYVCTEGPRLETASEIALYQRCGADLVGMTLSPEVFLAQEAGLAYASLCYITNYATGRASGRPPRRQFGPEVAHTCLPVLLAAASGGVDK